ncbi:BREX-1 system adenine-specific DNA-methyltransferase PglX [Clostridium sp. WILCCON 0269]|uniref:site-specific DNA-methyltransferase (adenine-specific) n=1 Tax=Candidatus Clostridium eludens TaxID=3381663 RepID=A0ABW8SST7_9CLOT
MNKNVLRNFAAKSRRELFEKVKIKAIKQGIKKDYVENLNSAGIYAKPLEKKMFSEEEKLQREIIINKMETLNKDGEEGYNTVIEEIACSWFNRFIALRFMEVNKYIPEIFAGRNIGFKSRVLSRCNTLNTSLPFIFQKAGHYTELLFPEGLLSEGTFVFKLVDSKVISEDSWKDVEIVGWLYEYYISEEKNNIMSAKKKYTKKQIPYATQLFTPDWIVKYMVQNSLGKQWIEAHPEHQDLKKGWEFYIEGSGNQYEIEEKLKTYIDKDVKVRDIKCFDPACGSGNILVYMFQVLYQIYIKCGYIKSEIPELIIENNLYGLDIHNKACKLACFAVIMEGMKHDKYILKKIERKGIKLNIVSIEETNSFDNNDIAYISGGNSGKKYSIIKDFIDKFKDAKIYGSLIELKDFKEDFLLDRLEYIKNIQEKDASREKRRKKIIRVLSELIKQARIMIGTYDILVTNPPYIGNKYLPPLLGKYIAKKYPDVKSDIFSAFIVYSFSRVKYNGQLAFMTPFVWMFIQSYEKLRKKIINYKNITSLIQLEYSGFEEATVPICTFTLRNYKVPIKGEYIKLSDFKGAGNQPIKVREAVINPYVSYRFTLNQEKMKNIPGNRFGYWLTHREIKILNKAKIIWDVAFPCTGMQTGNNSKYVRHWFEIKYQLINFTGESNNIKYWMPYQMGGEARKWYGNISEVIFWKNHGQKVRSEEGSLIRNEKFFFKKGISWKRITSGKNTIRILNKGFIFDQSADSIFVKKQDDYNYILSFFNTKIMENIFKFISPTLNLTAGTVKQIPIYMGVDIQVKEKINALCEECISISKVDWDSFETSWGFKRHPLLSVIDEKEICISHAFTAWKLFTDRQFEKLKHNEEELNRIFIHIYGLQDEVTPEVGDRDITIRKANRKGDIKSFISYAVGCMFGRYSIDKEGLIYAGEESDRENIYSVPYVPDADNIIPIVCENHFKNDIVSRFIEFVAAAFGERTLYENLNFIAETLGKKNDETDEDTIRRYFINDFFKDHVQVYKKRPIYWLFTSGKQKVFNCLIYIHRYDKDILSRIRIKYLHKFQDELCEKMQLLADIVEGNCEKEEKNCVKKKLEALRKQMSELKEYDELLRNKAGMKIEIDLDDGVKVNYRKFEGLLKK